jgi:CMP-N-acetylneuraminic acid synthetase
MTGKSDDGKMAATKIANVRVHVIETDSNFKCAVHKINKRYQTLQILYFQNSYIYIKELLITSPERKPLIKNSNIIYYMALQHMGTTKCRNK